MAAAVIGAAIAPAARADTPEDVMDQAIQYLNQGTTVLDAAGTADLSARQADILTATGQILMSLDRRAGRDGGHVAVGRR